MRTCIQYWWHLEDLFLAASIDKVTEWLGAISLSNHLHWFICLQKRHPNYNSRSRVFLNTLPSYLSVDYRSHVSYFFLRNSPHKRKRFAYQKSSRLLITGDKIGVESRAVPFMYMYKWQDIGYSMKAQSWEFLTHNEQRSCEIWLGTSGQTDNQIILKCESNSAFRRFWKIDSGGKNFVSSGILNREIMRVTQLTQILKLLSQINWEDFKLSNSSTGSFPNFNYCLLFSLDLSIQGEQNVIITIF